MTKTNAQIIEELKEAVHWPEKPTIVLVEDDTRVYIYGAEPHGGKFSDRMKRRQEMIDWCTNNFGAKEYGAYYADRWLEANGRFWFKTEADRMMFVLRWS